MITKEQFKQLINNHIKWDERITEVSKILDSQIWEADWVMYTGELFDRTLEYLFNDEAVDTINWWLWEKRGCPGPGMWDSEGNEIPTETLDDLWEIIKNEFKN